MRIALDGMGADGSPDIEIEGAVKASLESDTEILITGDEAVLTEKLAKHAKKGNIQIVHASEAISMHESPVIAVRTKKDSSLMVAMRLVKDGKADAVVSAGNTGAVMVAARTVLGPIRGVARSAICQVLPTLTGRVVVLDLGANVDCSARHLCEFAEMGIAYSHYLYSVENPRVGLLNIGEEAAKGTQVAKEAHRILSNTANINFVGNIEPRAMYNGDADVVVCDGFIGNVILKTSEAVAGLMAKLMRKAMESSNMNKLGAVLARNAINDLKKTVDPNEHPGAPLLGVNGTVMILHGSSTSLGIANGIHGGRLAVESKLNDHIRENIENLRSSELALGKEYVDEEPLPAEEAAG
nr:phosphate:acyl-ACP acyltransferase PlsX [uncultured bacterium]